LQKRGIGSGPDAITAVKHSTYKGHTAELTCADFCVRDTYLCSGSTDGSLLIYKISTEGADFYKRLCFSEHEGMPDLQVRGARFGKFGDILYAAFSYPSGVSYLV
jgi:WD40 repeat protein